MGQISLNIPLLNNFQNIPRAGDEAKQFSDNISTLKGALKSNLQGLKYSVSILALTDLVNDLKEESLEFIQE